MAIQHVSVSARGLRPTISKTNGDKGSLPGSSAFQFEHRSHVSDDVTWPWKEKVMTVIYLGSIISTSAGYRLGWMEHLQEMMLVDQMFMWLMTSR